jgi:Glucose / Sorbosone dehydrogenase
MMKLTCLALVVAGLTAVPASSASLELASVAPSVPISNPVQATEAPGDSSNIYVLDRKAGTVTVVDRTTHIASSTPFLTLPSTFLAGTTDDEVNNAFSIVFDPDYQNNGHVYVSYVDSVGNMRVDQATRTDPASNQVDPTKFQTILTVEHSGGQFFPHYGGDLDFGPDGYLYITTGDNKVVFDQVQSQNPNNLQGKILRIDPNADAFPDDAANNFTPAAGNPNAGSTHDVTDAVWATGLRNPFQASFDALTGTYLIADVGENQFEEINLGALGANFGWPGKEGTLLLRPGLLDGSVALTDPLFQYAHPPGPGPLFASVSGGLIYRGPITALNGRYIFADFVRNEFFSFIPDLANGTISDFLTYELTTDSPLFGPLSFMQTTDGALFVIAANGIFEVARATSDVPLPASGVLMLAGLALTAAARRKSKKMTRNLESQGAKAILFSPYGSCYPKR